MVWSEFCQRRNVRRLRRWTCLCFVRRLWEFQFAGPGVARCYAGRQLVKPQHSNGHLRPARVCCSSSSSLNIQLERFQYIRNVSVIRCLHCQQVCRVLISVSIIVWSASICSLAATVTAPATMARMLSQSQTWIQTSSVPRVPIDIEQE